MGAGALSVLGLLCGAGTGAPTVGLGLGHLDNFGKVAHSHSIDCPGAATAGRGSRTAAKIRAAGLIMRTPHI